MFPDAARLRRLLNYLPIRPSTSLVSVDKDQIIDSAAGNKLTPDALDKLNHIRRAVYNYKNYDQIGLFEFKAGLIFMEHGWFSEAAESFRKAGHKWSFHPDRANICLANFAAGVAHHRARRFDLAEMIYAGVREQVVRIREDLKGPASTPQVLKYQDFVKDLSAQLEEAQKTVTRDVFHDLSPRIHPSLQNDAPGLSSRHLLQVDQDVLQANIQRHLTQAELQALCYALQIDFNGLDGKVMADKARELIAYCVRNRRLSGFLQELSKRKPSVSWEDNIVQPAFEEYIEGEVVTEEEEVKEAENGRLDEVEPLEKGLEFFRTELGKIRFKDEQERVRPSSPPRMVVVNIELSGNFSNFSLEEQETFVNFISRTTDIDPNQITILAVTEGSIKVTLEMPFGGASLLIAMLLERDPILINFRILKVELGELVEPSPVPRPVTTTLAALMPRVTQQRLRQFIYLYFTDDELRDLYFEMNVDYDSLPGSGKREKARELVAFCNRHNKLEQLAAECQKERPDAFSETFSNS